MPQDVCVLLRHLLSPPAVCPFRSMFDDFGNLPRYVVDVTHLYRPGHAVDNDQAVQRLATVLLDGLLLVWKGHDVDWLFGGVLQRLERAFHDEPVLLERFGRRWRTPPRIVLLEHLE